MTDEPLPWETEDYLKEHSARHREALSYQKNRRRSVEEMQQQLLEWAREAKDRNMTTEAEVKETLF